MKKNRFSSCAALIFALALLAVVAAGAVPPGFAEGGSISEYVESRGFCFTDISDAPGYPPKCYMLENADSQAVCFFEDDKLYSIVALPMLDVNFDCRKMRDLFFDLVVRYDWDVSFYHPGYTTGSKILVSYGIVRDLDKTEKNYDDRSEYICALALALHPAGAQYDLGSMSYDDLVALKDQINLAMWNSEEWQEVTVPQGTWVVGEDIPEGHWNVKAVDGTCTYIQICTEIDPTGHDPIRESIVYYKGIYSPSYPAYMEGSDVVSWDFNVSTGQYIVISDGDAIFMPYSGKPSLGFK